MNVDLTLERSFHALRASLLTLIAAQWDRIQVLMLTNAEPNRIASARYRLARLMLAASMAMRLPVPRPRS